VAYLAVIIITVLNCVVLYFAAFLAVGGNGSATGIFMVWGIGFSWIAIAFALALYFCSRGKPPAGIAVSVATLPAALAVGQLLIGIGGVIPYLTPNPAAYEAACKTAAVQFFRQPALPVHSIAYDWNGPYDTAINMITIGRFGSASNYMFEDSPKASYPSSSLTEA
jgi:hypothetical protein